MQIEWLTAGECIAGMHEVVVTSKTIDAIKLAKEQNRSLWRVSSTVSLTNFIKSSPQKLNSLALSERFVFAGLPLQLFAHIASDAELKPLGHFAGSSLASNYPAIPAGEYVEQELSVINLKGKKGFS